MLDYKLLDALARVVGEGGFDKAARAMHLTQSAVSQRIRLLEDQAGMVVLTRTSPPRPTAQGKKLLKHYIQVRQLEKELAADLGGTGGRPFQTLALGINADSLATWFMPAVAAFVRDHRVLLDLKVDDQDQTHNLLRNGEVLGCISSQKNPVQGCRATPLGTMTYRMAATPAFRDRYFSQGLTPGALARARAVIFNRKDDLHAQYLKIRFRDPVPEIPAHYVPSSEQFVAIVLAGSAYGMVPDLQLDTHLAAGSLVPLDPGHAVGVDLYWHRWNLASRLLDDFSKAIVQTAVIC